MIMKIMEENNWNKSAWKIYEQTVSMENPIDIFIFNKAVYQIQLLLNK